MREKERIANYLHGRTPLVVRGSSQHTFRSLGLFAELGLLFCGTYLLGEALVQPLQAGAVSVIAGGLFLALATVLLFYLAWPISMNSTHRPMREQIHPVERAVTLRGEPADERAESSWMLEEEEELPGPM
ncbi:MAG TPA: hypothetical protein VL128_17420 [Candidatus Eisenbacteria bacterium]|nr:hypothetical protein [Candidatus Eisenbacteria bacterium]